MHEKPLPVRWLENYSAPDEDMINRKLQEALKSFNRKIVVLDDDPTGTQTVHGVPIFTSWEESSFDDGFAEEVGMFYILTNSRSFSAQKTKEAHAEIAKRMLKSARRAGVSFLCLSRGDSTLRGHYPLETETLRETLESAGDIKFDGEIIYPFLKEGGRVTIDNIHYVREGGELIPAAMTEFARDQSFGYAASHLGEWCEEKTCGQYKARDMIYISLQSLRGLDIDGICARLMSAENFNKIIVNSIDYCDVKVFCIALIDAMQKGKRFIIRGAAGVAKILGGITGKPLLTKSEIIPGDNGNGGIVIAGSHVQKTTAQIMALKDCRKPVSFIEFDQHLALSEAGLEPEVKRVAAECERQMLEGNTVVVYTRRERLDLDMEDSEAQLAFSVTISDAVTGVIKRLRIRPGFIIAKGGITSSDVATKALGIQKATVMGQIQPGIPVWRMEAESKFPGMPFIVFPGNVGQEDTLKKMVETLTE